MSMITRPIPLVALAGLAIAGCNDDVPFFPNPDATTSDMSSDTGSAPDGGVTPDGGVMPDTGTTDTGDDGGTAVDVGLFPDGETDTTPVPDTGSDAGSDVGSGSAIRAAIQAYCDAAATCQGNPEFAERCTNYFSYIESAFALQTEQCQQAVLNYLGCSATSETACYEDEDGFYFDGERGCEIEYRRQDAACPDDY